MSCFLNAKQVAKLVNDFFGISCGDSATPSFTKPKQPLLHHGDEFFAPKRLPTHSPLILPRPTVNFQREYLAYYIHAGTVPSCLLQNRVPFCSFGIWVRAGLGCFLPEFWASCGFILRLSVPTFCAARFLPVYFQIVSKTHEIPSDGFNTFYFLNPFNIEYYFLRND